MKKIFSKIIKSNFLKAALVGLFALLSFEARADLVEDLIKKHHLDPKNNPKDQCELMYQIKDWVIAFGGINKGMSLCEDGGICFRRLNIYNYNQNKKIWKEDDYNHLLIYEEKPYKIIGLFGYILQGFDEENHDFELYKKNHRGFPNKEYFLADIRANKEFKKAKARKENISSDFNDEELKLTRFDNQPTNTSYIKVRGCYVKDFKIIKSDKKLYQPQRHN